MNSYLLFELFFWADSVVTNLTLFCFSVVLFLPFRLAIFFSLIFFYRFY